MYFNAGYRDMDTSSRSTSYQSCTTVLGICELKKIEGTLFPATWHTMHFYIMTFLLN